MSDTTHLSLPYIEAAQAQKHVTHNEALRALDAIVQLSVLDRDLTAPPGSPADGARYLVAASPTGAWSGQAGKIAAWQDGAWAFYTPKTGWAAWIADEQLFLVHNGLVWSSPAPPAVLAALLTAQALQNLSLLGVNTTADATNKLAVASAASLFNHAGAGHQQKINKNASGDSASQLYQTNFSGRAEIGLLGNDDFAFKVSPNGTTFTTALLLDRTTGQVEATDGAAALPAITFQSDTDTGFWRVAANTIGIAVGGAEQARLDAIGLGVGGAATGVNKLEVTGSAARFRRTSAGNFTFSVDADNGKGDIVFNGYSDTPLAGSQFQFNRRRGALGTPAAVDNGDLLFALQGQGWDGAALRNACQLWGRVDGTVSSGVVPGRWEFYATDTAGAAGLRMTLKGDGRLGIGVTSPSCSLHTNGPIRPASYTIATAPSASASGAGAMIYVSNESGGAVIAFSDGTNWRRVTDRAVIS
ncbi:MAG: DUF2793 domain-containing protein [Hyphomicrobiales bacterium]|nr:DUF2793 domain-containing protein [Hyphomicrobiales bacterium]